MHAIVLIHSFGGRFIDATLFDTRKPLVGFLYEHENMEAAESIEEVATNNNNGESESKYWDQFVSKPDTSDGSKNGRPAFVVLYRFLKVILYGFLFVAILGGLITSRLALISMVKNFGEYQKMLAELEDDDSNATIAIDEQAALISSFRVQRDGWVYLIIFSIIVPYVLTFLQSIWELLICKQPPIGWHMLIGCCYTVGTEAIHSIGLSLFLWRVLPSLNAIEASGVFTAIGVVPLLLHIFCKKKSRETGVENCGECVNRARCATALDIIAFILHLAAYILISVFVAVQYGMRWETPVSLFLLSFPHIKNYLPAKFEHWAVSQPETEGKEAFKEWMLNFPVARMQWYWLASAIKVGLTFGLAFAWVDRLEPPYIAFPVLGREYPEWSTLTLYAPLIVLSTVPFLTYHFAKWSAQLLMQKICYAATLCFSTPALLIAAAAFSNSAPELLVFHPQIALPVHASKAEWFIFGSAIVCCITQGIACRHLWFPNNRRLEHGDKLFVLPNYCPVFFEQSLAYNRTRSSLEPERSPTQNRDGSEDSLNQDIPKIYLCGTMWHETTTEMKQFLESILRLDKDQAAKRDSPKVQRLRQNEQLITDYFDFEVHIMFDDAMKLSKENKWVLNDFVSTFVETITEAARSLDYQPGQIPPPVKVPTPYGGQLIYKLPGQHELVVHLKDKNRIRHRKRWSQVMYMYYLLGFKNLRDFEMSDGYLGFTTNKHLEATIFKRLPKDAKKKSDNTFILALDGDVDFQPIALHLLIDRLKKNDKVGVACGRIHPIGSGPMVWYQKFEYSVGHWLQKAAEHVLGCVLCAPGCFSLFKGSAIMDDNIMKVYTTDATEARHFVQYDQGEDRWLSTLLLQRGYKVEYVAASDAFTYAPETFKEFFNQRRRWGPSTMANIYDLFDTARSSVKRNDSLSWPYMIYQIFIFVSSIIGPAIIVLLIAETMEQVFNLSEGGALAFALIPPLLFLMFCFVAASDTQIAVAAILSAFYAVLMTTSAIGGITSIAIQGLLSPAVVFLVLLVGIFILTAALHPQEFTNLLYGPLYYLTIPSGYLLLVIYSMANMNSVSWGTRETGKAAKANKTNGWLHSLVDKQLDEDSVCSKLGSLIRRCCCKTKQAMEISMVIDKERQIVLKNETHNNRKERPESNVQDEQEDAMEGETISTEDDPINPAWMDSGCLQGSTRKDLEDVEAAFWHELIEKYLKPIEKDAAKEARLADQLKGMRNNVCFAFFMLNAFWIAANFSLQLKLPDLVEVLTFRGIILEPFSLVALAVFGTMLVIQFLAMLAHRWETFKHIIAATELNCCETPRCADPEQQQ